MKRPDSTEKILMIVDRLIEVYLSNKEVNLNEIKPTLNQYIMKILNSSLIPMPPNSESNENISSQIQKQVYNQATARNDTTLNNKIYHLQALQRELSKKTVVKSKMNCQHLLYKISLQENSNDQNNHLKPSDFISRVNKRDGDHDKPNPWNIDWGAQIYSPMYKLDMRKYEILILKQTIQALQYKNSSYFVYSDQKKSYDVNINIKISRPKMILILELLEKNVIYIQLRSMIEAKKTQIQGTIENLFFNQVEIILNDYNKLLETINNKILIDEENFSNKNSILMSECSTVDSNSHNDEEIKLFNYNNSEKGQNLNNGNDLMCKELTLKGLYLELLDPLITIKEQGVLCESCQKLKGANLINSVYVYYKNGYKTISNNFLFQIMQQFKKYLLKWINHGELDDPMSEFFIRCHSEVSDLQSYWKEKYTIESSKKLLFLSEAANESIQEIGKSRILLLNYQNCPFEGTIDMQITDVFSNNIWDFNKFEGEITKLKDSIGSFLKTNFLKLSDFMGHLKFIKKTILMGQGDFIDSIYNTMNEELSQPAMGILKHQVFEKFIGIVTKSSLRNERVEYISRLGIEILEVSEAEIGWDVFRIDYDVPDIMGYVLNKKYQLNLLRLSNYFWKVRRHYYRLNDIWLEQKNILQKLNRNLPFSDVWNKSNLIRHHLTLFITNLISYFINEVIESEWTILQRQIEEPNMTFDYQKNAIETFINNLLEKTFIDKKYESIFSKIEAIFGICDSFTNSYRSLCMSYNLYIHNFVNDGDEKRRAADCFKQTFVLINKVWDTYENVYWELLQDFKKLEDTRSLVFKFDFNGFHEINHERQVTKLYYQNLKAEKNALFHRDWVGENASESDLMIIEDNSSFQWFCLENFLVWVNFYSWII